MAVDSLIDDNSDTYYVDVSGVYGYKSLGVLDLITRNAGRRQTIVVKYYGVLK